MVGFGLAFAATGLMPATAEAHHRHHAHRTVRLFAHQHQHHHGNPGLTEPHFAAIVVDGNTGAMLYGRNENELRHPASITKVMTLYLLFEQLDHGHMHLDSEISISPHAAAQAPTKLGLRPGATIKVEDAIKAIVTRSANDIAVAVAEAIGGDEDSFAEMMTRKAHALGMSHTHYANASGLPNDEQLTTAHDLALLGRAVQERYPRYYHYFSTHVFHYGHMAIANHNHLLDRVDGMDGIKTGYTRASGFNLLSSVKRNGRYIVSVVLGGTSAAGRDRIMAGLIEEHIREASTAHSAPAIAENGAEREDAPPRAPILAKAEPKPEPRIAAKPTPLPLRPETSGAQPQLAAAGPAEDRVRPAFVSGAPKPMAPDAHTALEAVNARHATLDGSTAHPIQAAAYATATPSNLRWVTGPAPVAAKEKPAETTKLAKAEAAPAEPIKAAEPLHLSAPHSGWMIQIGATDDAAKAGELLARARSQGHASLDTAQPFTEKVQKGGGTLYRARFAGLEAGSAEAACKALKRSGFSCFATRN